MTESHELMNLDLEKLRDHCVAVLKKAENTRADVLLIDVKGHKAVLKDYTHSSRGFKILIAPLLVMREVKALRALDSVAEVPSLIRKISIHAFLMEYVPGKRIRFMRDKINFKVFIENTEALVKKLHHQGVVHGDLRNATNILVTDENQPVLVDFVSAVHRGHALNPFSWALYNMCLIIDRGAMYKLREKYLPQSITQTERQSYEQTKPGETIARWISVRIRNLVQKIFP